MIEASSRREVLALRDIDEVVNRQDPVRSVMGVGDEIGPWRLVTRLGRGGNSNVFRAEQDDGLTAAVGGSNCDGGWLVPGQRRDVMSGTCRGSRGTRLGSGYAALMSARQRLPASNGTRDR